MIRSMLGALLALLAAAGVARAQPAYDAEGWVRDLGVVREAVGARYANLQWAVEEREADLPARFASAERLLRSAENDTEARRVFERFAEGLGDGHVEFRWPVRATTAAAASGQAAARPTPCDSIGVRAVPDRGTLAARMQGWREIAPREAAFAAGTLPAAGRTVGVVRIPLFMPTSRPELCAAALQRLSLAAETECDDACRRRLTDTLTALYTEAFADTLRRLRAAGAEVLLVDLTNNGGGRSGPKPPRGWSRPCACGRRSWP